MNSVEWSRMRGKREEWGRSWDIERIVWTFMIDNKEGL